MLVKLWEHKINYGNTKIVVPIPIDKQHAFVQELAGGTLTEETITEETKDAFLKFIAVRNKVQICYLTR